MMRTERFEDIVVTGEDVRVQMKGNIFGVEVVVDLRRRRQEGVVINGRCQVIEGCHICYPDIADLHGYVVAIVQIVTNNDPGGDIDHDPVVQQVERFLYIIRFFFREAKVGT